MSIRSPKSYSFQELPDAPLCVDARYIGKKYSGQDGASIIADRGEYLGLRGTPYPKLLQGSNVGGFRFKNGVKYCGLITSLSEGDWPDSIEMERGIFTYYGDNRTAGTVDLHSRRGNSLMRDVFARLHRGERASIPAFLVFESVSDVELIFRGLAVPGARSLSESEDLVAVWKSDSIGGRFQNYRAIFTILDVPMLSRAWLRDLEKGEILTGNTPPPYKDWVEKNIYKPLIAPRSLTERTREEQLPKSKLEWEILETLIGFYKVHAQGEYAFERCAEEICKIADTNILELRLTPPHRDGGRDGIGIYRIGTAHAYVPVDFAMEAKCYAVHASNGVHLTSRLISRLRHRQFGYFVTTSFVAKQAYREIVDDKHPVVIYSGGDIARILIEAGKNTSEKLVRWLKALDP